MRGQRLCGAERLAMKDTVLCCDSVRKAHCVRAGVILLGACYGYAGGVLFGVRMNVGTRYEWIFVRYLSDTLVRTCI